MNKITITRTKYKHGDEYDYCDTSFPHDIVESEDMIEFVNANDMINELKDLSEIVGNVLAQKGISKVFFKVAHLIDELSPMPNKQSEK